MEILPPPMNLIYLRDLLNAVDFWAEAHCEIAVALYLVTSHSHLMALCYVTIAPHFLRLHCHPLTYSIQ
jgi:hypothetical protein